MKPLMRSINWAAKGFNHLPLWKGECRVWAQRMVSPSFDRWLYLRLHRVRLMGRGEREFLAQTIRPGTRVLDVGSNIGLYSIHMARLVGATGRVTSFEPDPELFAVFQRNCALNEISNLKAHSLALGSAPARLELHRMLINSGDNHLGETSSGFFREAITTEVVALDDFLPGFEVDFIKIDVQGWELEALRGMRRILEANRDVQIYFEFMPDGYRRAGSDYAQLEDFFRSLQFRIINPADGQELTREGMAALARSLPGVRYTNLLARR